MGNANTSAAKGEGQGQAGASSANSSTPHSTDPTAGKPPLPRPPSVGHASDAQALMASRALREHSGTHSRSQPDMVGEAGKGGGGRESMDSPRGSRESFTKPGIKSALASSRSASDVQHVHKVHSVAAFGKLV